jgi:exopolysaccharide biosynthesis polyprenyl glycosylphosphotransferase
MLRRFSVNFAIFSVVVDGLTVAFALFFSALVRPSMSAISWLAPITAVVQLPPGLYLLFPICWVGILASFAVYDGKRYLRAVDEFTALSLGSLLAGVALAGVLYLSYREISRAQYLTFVLSAYLIMAGWRVIARIGFRLRREHLPEVARRALVVGTGPIGRMVQSRLLSRQDLDVSLSGFVDDEPADGFEGQLMGKLSELRAVVDWSQATDVIIALPPHFYGQIRAAVDCLSDAAVRVWIALGFFDLALYRTAMEDLAGIPLLDLRASALDDYERTAKRAFDLVGATLAAIVASPFMALAAAAIWLDGGGPILFRQQRVGENGRLFEMLKFRTMVKNADELRHLVEQHDANGNLLHKAKDDPRVTRVGRWLRRLSLDELPQLINVLKGEMSLVGPRPEMPHLVEQYEPWQRQRWAVPPGITGWWQVTGRSDKVMHLHTEDDLFYVQNYSIWLDLRIIMRTLWVVLLGKGAF